MTPGDEVLFRNLDLFAQPLGLFMQDISPGLLPDGFIGPVLIHVTVELQALRQFENITRVIFQDDRDLAAGSSAADVVHPVHPGIMPLRKRFLFPLYIESRAGFTRNEFAPEFPAVDQFQGTV